MLLMFATATVILVWVSYLIVRDPDGISDPNRRRQKPSAIGAQPHLEPAE